MATTSSQTENLLLVQYTNEISEERLNWGFQGSYLSEEKLPILFVFSNFPPGNRTNRKTLVGNLRTFIEERKGIIFYPVHLKTTVEELVEESLQKENVSLFPISYSDPQFTPGYFSQICESKFSIKEISIEKEVIKMAMQPVQQQKNVHLEIFKDLKESKDTSVVCFLLDKANKEVKEMSNLDSQPSLKRSATFSKIVQDPAFKTRFSDLFLGDKSIPIRIRNFFGGAKWKVDSMLISYSSKNKCTFIQDVETSAFFLSASDDTFTTINTQYSLFSFSYAQKPEQRFIMIRDNISKRFDIYEDKTPLNDPNLRIDMLNTFSRGMETVNSFLDLISHTRLNECRFYYDKMCVVIKISGNKYIIETYPGK